MHSSSAFDHKQYDTINLILGRAKHLLDYSFSDLWPTGSNYYSLFKTSQDIQLLQIIKWPTKVT